MKLHLTLCLIFCLTTSTTLMAGTVVVQKVQSQVAGDSTSTKHIWWIDGKKFNLLVESAKASTRYIFNGRTFYVCSKLDQEQLSFLESHQIGNKKILGQFKKGACQTAPSNFMVRFFLSPSDAVESINQSDGMKVTIALDQYGLTQRKGNDKVSGRTCKPFQRNYNIIKSGETNQGKFSLSNEIEEQLCEDGTLDWRNGLWQEVAKVVIRQPGGTSLMNKLRLDHARLGGFVLESAIKVHAKNGKGQSYMTQRQVNTLKMTTKKFSNRAFRLPPGYELFSPESLVIAAGRGSKISKVSDGTGQSEDHLETFQSIFFCAIAGALGCLSF